MYSLPLFESHVLNPSVKHIICICRTVIDILQLLCVYLILNFKFIFYLLQSHYLKSVSGSALALLLANNQDVAVAVKVMENLNVDILEDFFMEVCYIYSNTLLSPILYFITHVP